MGRIAAILVCFIALYLLFPAESSLENIPDNKVKAVAADTLSAPPVLKTEIIKESEIEKICPSIIELPLMPGRPAPCLATYPLF